MIKDLKKFMGIKTSEQKREEARQKQLAEQLAAMRRLDAIRATRQIATRRDEVELETKMIKTGVVLCAINIVTGLFCAATDDSSIGLLVVLIVNAVCLQQFHEQGKNRRIGTNLLFNFAGAIASPEERVQLELYNAFRNTINGGAHFADKIVESVNRL